MPCCSLVSSHKFVFEINCIKLRLFHDLFQVAAGGMILHSAICQQRLGVTQWNYCSKEQCREGESTASAFFNLKYSYI